MRFWSPLTKIKADLEEIRPSLLLEGLTETFNQLEAQIDRFKPSVVFAPVAELATPLLALLENIQQETVDALFQLFAAPVGVLNRLEPQALEAEIKGKVDLLFGVTHNPGSAQPLQRPESQTLRHEWRRSGGRYQGQCRSFRI